MTYFEVTEKQLDEYGKVFPEYDKFARQGNGVTWVPLLVGPNRVKRFALSNLKEVRAPFMTDMLYTCAEPPPMVIFPMPDMFPQAVFLAAANYALHQKLAAIDELQAQKSAKLIIKAVADGQLPRVA